MLDMLSHAQHFVTLWIVAHQAPLSMGFPRQDTGVGCHFLFLEIFLTQGSNVPLLQWQAPSLPLSRQGSPAITCIAVVVSVAQSCPTLCDPMDRSPGSSVHGILQARTLEWVAISFSNHMYTLLNFTGGGGAGRGTSKSTTLSSYTKLPKWSFQLNSLRMGVALSLKSQLRWRRKTFSVTWSKTGLY